MIRICGPSIL